MGHYLYRKARRAATVLVTAALIAAIALPLMAQLRQQREKPRGPRAVAVLEFTGETARLIPVFILEDGRYYDAGLYRATPVPMSLEPGVVYEAERTGDSLGLFTVTDARRDGRSWYGLGDWRPKSAAATAGANASDGDLEDEGPPVLRRPGEAPPPAPTDEGEGPDRPVMRRPQAPAASLPQPADDPDRPILRRGRPQEQAAAGSASPAAEPAPDVADPAPPDDEPETQREYVVAVSDAEPPPRHAFGYEFRPGEEERMLRQMAQLAQEELARQAAARGLPVQRLAGAQFENPRLHAFDLDYDGSAELVFTADMNIAAAPKAKPVPWHVAVVARADREGKAQKLWASVTSSERLDVARRLELIDAVDADGDGRAELLFRAHGRGGHGYELYRVARYTVERIFDGAWTAD
jgi:hypothetical protein